MRTRNWSEPRDLTAPREGLYEVSLCRGGWPVPTRIERDAERSAWVLDVGTTGQREEAHDDALLAGHVPPLLYRTILWGRVVSEERWTWLVATFRWALAHEPRHPCLRPEQRIDLATVPIDVIFPEVGND